MTAVRRIAQKIKNRRGMFVVRGECDLRVSSSNIEAIKTLQHVRLIANGDSSRAANIQHAQLTPLGEVVCLQRVSESKRQRHASGAAIPTTSSIQIDIRHLNGPDW